MSLIDKLVARFASLPEEVGPPAIGSIQPTENTHTTLPSGFIRRVVEMRDNLPEMTRLGQPGMVHLSALVTLCARQHCLMLDNQMSTSDRVTGAHRVMWQIGKAVERHVRNQMIEGMPTQILGRWVCACGETNVAGHKPAARRCSGCDHRVDQYREMTLVDEFNGVAGNPDVVVRGADNLYVPVEIKSMVKTQWDDLRSPLANHIMQAAGYRRLLQVNGFPVHPDVVIIYVAKDFAWGSPYKEFHIKITRLLEQQLDDLFAEAKLVRDYLATGVLPPRVHCSLIGQRRAKDCPTSAHCFARN